jgi:hypothetical protein
LKLPKIYNRPAETVSVVDARRVASEFDPTIAQPITREVLRNDRLPSSASQAIREVLGAGYDEELDHQIALTLRGSNVRENLNLEDKEVNRIAGTKEAQLANKITAGEISLLDAQLQMAKEKGIKLPESEPTLREKIQNKVLEITPPKVLEELADIQKKPTSIFGKLYEGFKKGVLNIAEDLPITKIVANIQAGMSPVEALKKGDSSGFNEKLVRKQEEFINQGVEPEEAKTKAFFALAKEESEFAVAGFLGGQGEKKVSDKAAKKVRGFIESAKNLITDLDKTSGQYIPRETDKLAIKAKNLIKENIDIAENLATYGSDDAAVATASELLKHYSLEAEKATSQSVKNALYDKAAKIANSIAPKLTESGRSIQAASILGRLTPEGQVKFAASQIAKYNEGLVLAKRIPELTGEQSRYILNEMKFINGMAEGVEKAMKFQKLQNYISDLVPSPLIKKVIAVWKAGLLTGIKTQGLNIFANISHAGTEIVKDIPATMVDKIVSLFTGKRAVTITTKGEISGIKEGVQKGLRYLTTGFDERNIGAKLDYKRVNFGEGKIKKALQTYTDTVFRVLGTEDQPFYYAAKIRSMFEQAKVKAINKGLKGKEAQAFIDNLIQNPTDDMIRYASMDAEIAVFQNRTLLGEAAKGIQKVGKGIGEFLVPFGRTPSAVATQILNYSPVGLVKTIVENIGKGRFDQRLFSQGIGRAITGTGAMYIGAELFKNGLMTLESPKNERERELWKLEGRKANSIKIGDKWRTIQTLGPVGNVLITGGHLQNEFSNSGSPSEAMANALAGASLSFTEQTFLTGVSNFIDAISDPTRSAENVAGSTLASGIPTIISDIGRASDDKERRANTIIEKLQARIPGVRETLEPQVSVLGEERERIGNVLEVLADPTRPSEEKSTPVVSELRRLWDAGYKVSPTLLGDKKGYEGLTDKQNTELWKLAGEITNEKLSNLFISEQYQKLAEDEKAKKVNDFVEKSKVSARAGMVLELTQDLQGAEWAKKLSELKKSGLMTREVYNKYLEIK